MSAEVRTATLTRRETTESQPPAGTPASNVRYGPGGGVYRIVMWAEDTGYSHFAFEATEPPGGGPPLHIHRTEDELFLVLEGEMSFYIDGRVIHASKGETAFVPRGAAHCFKNTSDRESKVLVLFTPGHIEGFFDYGASATGERPTDEQLLARLSELAPLYNLEVLGPSPL